MLVYEEKISLMASMVLYLIAIIILIYYFSLEFNELLHLSPNLLYLMIIFLEEILIY